MKADVYQRNYCCRGSIKFTGERFAAVVAVGGLTVGVVVLVVVMVAMEVVAVVAVVAAVVVNLKMLHVLSLFQ